MVPTDGAAGRLWCRPTERSDDYDSDRRSGRATMVPTDGAVGTRLAEGLKLPLKSPSIF